MYFGFINKYKVILSYLFFLTLFIITFFYPEKISFQILGVASLFALSGAVTNWLAVYLLFEKIPFIIGSGVIPNKFESFKNSIRSIILDNFFREENFLAVGADLVKINWQNKIIQKINFKELFDKVMKSFIKSEKGSILKMLGGEKILENFRAPFEELAKKETKILLAKIDLQKILTKEQNYTSFMQKVTQITDKELEKLTPQKVKIMVEKIIKEQLSWLVVWGGVFGFLLGLFSNLFISI